LRRLLLALLLLAPVPVRAQGDEITWLLAQINDFRGANGLGPLSLNQQLTASALSHSKYLSTNPWIDAHREADGSMPLDRARAAGYTGRVGENVYGGGRATAQIAFDWWLSSSLHRANILSSSWGEIGIGIANSSQGTYYTLLFGNGKSPGPAPTRPPATASDDGSPTGTPTGPTRRPPTRAPTATPTTTLTPSSTFTPRPTFTPTITPSVPPPTGTPILLGVTPQAQGTPGQQARTAIAQAASPTNPAPATSANPPGPASGDALRNLLPWAIALQMTLVGGLVLNSIRRHLRR
jgi:hypothetical protein